MAKLQSFEAFLLWILPSLVLLRVAQFYHISNVKRIQPLTARGLSHIRCADRMTHLEQEESEELIYIFSILTLCGLSLRFT